MTSRLCTSCGASLADGAAFCTACGAAVPAQATELLPVQPEATTTAAAVPDQPAPAAKKPGVPVWVWVVIGAVVLILVGAGAWALIAQPWADEAEPVVAEEPAAEEESVGTEASETEAEEPPPVAESPYTGMPISMPPKGDADRTGLMDAARRLTGSTGQFLVWQLYVQGDSAIGDIQEFKGEGVTPGRRWLVTWERVNGGWQGREYGPFLDAGRIDVRTENPFLSGEIVSRVAFVMPVSAPPHAQDAAEAAQNSDYGAFEIWVPTRLPEGYSFGDESYEPNMCRFTWSSGSDEIGMVIGWGDGEIGAAEDLVSAPANWGPRDGWYLSSADLGYDEISGSTTATTELWGDVPEFLLRAVAMSMVEVSP